MTVKDRLEKLKNDNYMIYHKALKDTKMLEDDWIRIYKSKNHGCIDEGIYSCDVKDIDKIPDNIMNMEYDHEDSWVIGGDLSLDLVIDIKENN